MRLASWLLAAVLAAAVFAGARWLARWAARHPSAGPWRQALARVAADRGSSIALAGLAVLAVACALAPALAPYHPAFQPDILALQGRPPSAAHPFGTDVFSRDVLSRMLYGARVSLGVAVLAVTVSTTVGTLYGSLAGLAGAAVDGAMMRVIDACLAVPRVLLLIAVLGLWGRVPLPALVALIGLTGWFGVSRLVRTQVRALRGEDFIVSANALGAGRARVLLRHVLPNVMSPVIVAATLGVGNVILLEAGLSYLGLGVQPPQPSWGNIVQDGGDQIARYWWMALFPGLAIVLTVMAFNALGDALRDALDPQARTAPAGAGPRP
ncbi:MAG TPA: ABC transporter permease [Gemmatimonadaceae bacterium]|nr:ABC transporter permease [Gemmatimonadaceae bacterium]